MKPLTPLLVDLEPVWRGGQNQALLILKGLKAQGHQPELVAAKNSALGERAASLGIPVHSVSRGLARLPAAAKIRQLVRSRRFDLVHANEAHAVSAAWLGRAHRTLPFVISRRVGYPLGKSRMARARYEAATRIIANSQWVADQAIASGAPKDKVTVVYEGAEIPLRFSVEQRKAARVRWKIADDIPLLGCVGVLLPDKGQEWLIRALAELRMGSFQTKLLLAGDGPRRSQLEALARELGVADDVIFAGFVKDVENVYAALDVFLLPSFFEALNNSLLAAMAYEIPSIAFRRGALGEIIEDGKSGLLVEAANLEQLRLAVEKLLCNQDFSRKLGQEARQRIEKNFSAERMVEGMLRIYTEVLSERKMRP